MVFIGACVGAPLVEEAAKALGLRGLRRWILSPADGWLLGFASGIGQNAGRRILIRASLVYGRLDAAGALLLQSATSLTGLGYARYLHRAAGQNSRRGYLSGDHAACGMTPRSPLPVWQ
jgi:hypothetical protein